MSKTDTTVVVRMGEKQERFYRNIVEAPSVAEFMRREVLQYEKHAVQYEQADEEETANSNDSAQLK